MIYLKTTTYPGIAPLLTPGRQARFINMAFRKNIWKYPHMHEKAPGSLPYYELCVIMQRIGEKKPFVTTPYAFPQDINLLLNYSIL